MVTASSSKSLRPKELPSRHSIGVPPSSRQRGSLNTIPRAHDATPTRAKLKHAATAPYTSSTESSSNDAHACHHCHLMNTRFYCDACLASRIEAHHSEMWRLSLARDKAKASAHRLLFDRDDPSSSAATSSPSIPRSLPIHTIDEDALPDPFDTHAAEASSSDAMQDRLLLHSLVQLRAKRASIIARVQHIHQCISESEQTHLSGKQLLEEKRAQLALRKQNLAKAWSGLEGSSAAASSSPSQRSRYAAKSHWLARPAADQNDVPSTHTDVYTHYERQSDHFDNIANGSSESSDQQLGAVLTRARHHLAALQTEAVTVSAELAATRAALARQAFKLFSVSSPDAPPLSKTTAPNRTSHVDLSASSSVAQRISRLSERYIPGAFGLGQSNLLSSPAAQLRGSNRDPVATQHRQTNPKDPPTGTQSSSRNWSIASLPLPLPSEARRYPRETVNGAVTYTVNLLQLVAGYLGIALPFSIEQHKGRFAIRPDPLWDGGGGSSAKTLYLSSSAYTHLTASHSAAAHRQSKLNNLAESTYGLGASTLSTIESYIHLPAGTHLPWGLSSTAAALPHPSEAVVDAGDKDADADHGRRSEADPRTPSKSKSDQAAKSFVSALVMLCYDVAYLATKQGVQLDLVAAAANPLDLLTRVMRKAELGRLAHANHIRSSSIQDLSLPLLDYEQLAQILEPNNAAADSYKRGTSKANKTESDKRATSRQPSARASKQPAILEQSYVDVGQAAASVLDIKDPSTLISKPAAQPSSQRASLQKKAAEDPKANLSRQTSQSEAASSLQKQRIRADKRGPVAAQPPPSLDFLRQRGRDATKASPSPSTKTSNDGPNTHTKAPQASSAKAGPGAVIFNGVEVGVGIVDSNDPTRGLGKKLPRPLAEEGWDLV